MATIVYKPDLSNLNANLTLANLPYVLFDDINNGVCQVTEYQYDNAGHMVLQTVVTGVSISSVIRARSGNYVRRS